MLAAWLAYFYLPRGRSDAELRRPPARFDRQAAHSGHARGVDFNFACDGGQRVGAFFLDLMIMVGCCDPHPRGGILIAAMGSRIEMGGVIWCSAFSCSQFLLHCHGDGAKGFEWENVSSACGW